MSGPPASPNPEGSWWGSRRIIWSLDLAMFLVWLVGVLLGKGGFLHLLFLCAVGVAFVQWIADRRAAQG